MTEFYPYCGFIMGVADFGGIGTIEVQSSDESGQIQSLGTAADRTEFMRLRDKTMTSEAIAQWLLSGGRHAVRPEPGAIDLCPTAWPEKELVQFIETSRRWGQLQPAASGKEGMVAGTTQALAVRAGVEALRKGGTAMDAACVTALTQISLNAGATVSYAGIMSLVYYEAESGEVHALMAPFSIPLGEDSPQTIPKSGTPSGRRPRRLSAQRDEPRDRTGGGETDSGKQCDRQWPARGYGWLSA